MQLFFRYIFFYSIAAIFSLNVSAQGGFNIYGAKVNVNTGGNIYSEGNIKIESGGLISNSGTIKVSSDWINNSGDTAVPTGFVLLNGDTQLISGTDVTVFDTLELSGTGRKELGINTAIDSILILNDREFFTDSFTLTINNTDSAAISRTSGFVSSDSLGTLIRLMADTTTYLFPVGSNEGTDRYRPIEITPASVTAQSHAVRFINNDPQADGYNANMRGKGIVYINDIYYHEIKQQNSNEMADVNFYFNRNEDGDFKDAVNWNTYDSRWNSLTGDTVSDPVTSMVRLTIPSLTDTGSGIYALSNTASFRIITEDLEAVNYDISGAGLTGAYQSGGTEIFIPDIPLLDDTTITININAGAASDSMKIIFDMNTQAVLSNVRAVLYDTTAADTFALDSSFHKIIESRDLYLVNGDSLVVGDSAFAGTLVLENGLLLSPDNDDSYDELVVTGLESVISYTLNVRNSEDNLVFTTTDKATFWNGLYMNTGSLVAKGVYKYEMQLDNRTIIGQLLVNY